MAKSRNVDHGAWHAFLDSRPPLTVGATGAYPGRFPEGLGLMARIAVGPLTFAGVTWREPQQRHH
jgi:hypothetical protein